MENKIDDGSLSFLNIKIDGELKTYDCPVIKQSYLINKTFFICDYEKNLKTKFGEDRYLIFIKFNINDVNEIGNKFFTNSKKIKFILDKISELNAFPRKVTLQQIGNKFELK